VIYLPLKPKLLIFSMTKVDKNLTIRTGGEFDVVDGGLHFKESRVVSVNGRVLPSASWLRPIDASSCIIKGAEKPNGDGPLFKCSFVQKVCFREDGSKFNVPSVEVSPFEPTGKLQLSGLACTCVHAKAKAFGREEVKLPSLTI